MPTSRNWSLQQAELCLLLADLQGILFFLTRLRPTRRRDYDRTMNEFVTVSSSSYDPASLATKLTEKAGEGWTVVAIVPPFRYQSLHRVGRAV